MLMKTNFFFHALLANLSGSFIGVDSEDYLNEISIYDFVPYTESAFTQLLKERENMKVFHA